MDIIQFQVTNLRVTYPADIEWAAPKVETANPSDFRSVSPLFGFLFLITTT